MTRVQYAVNGLALLALTVGLAIYDARTLGCLLVACILSAAIGISIGERNTQPSLRKVTPMADRIDHAAEAQKVLTMPTSVWGSPSDVLAGAQVHATRTEGEFDRWLAAHDGAIREQIAARIEAKAQFLKAWKCWDSDAQYLPDNWESRVENWLLQGIALEQLLEALEIALANGWVSVSHIFRYMSGIVGRWLDEIDSRIEREVKGGNHGA